MVVDADGDKCAATVMRAARKRVASATAGLAAAAAAAASHHEVYAQEGGMHAEQRSGIYVHGVTCAG